MNSTTPPNVTYDICDGPTDSRVVARVNCERNSQLQSFVVAKIVNPNESNPGLLIETPLGINAVEEVCAAIRADRMGPRTNDRPISKAVITHLFEADDLAAYTECEAIIARNFAPRNGQCVIDARKILSKSIDGCGVTMSEVARLLNMIDDLALRVVKPAVK